MKPRPVLAITVSRVEPDKAVPPSICNISPEVFNLTVGAGLSQVFLTIMGILDDLMSCWLALLWGLPDEQLRVDGPENICKSEVRGRKSCFFFFFFFFFFFLLL